jgi:non-heme chloroperoxidase
MSGITVNHTMLGLKGVNLHVEDHGGDGRPVILIHGWPLSGKSWSEQIDALTGAGLRVITYDRRGFGESDKPTSGYDYDTFSEDLRGVIESMQLTDFSLVGFSMGGGEVARYIAKYGEEGVHSLVFASAIPPYLMKSEDNPTGPLTSDIATEWAKNLEADDTGFYAAFAKQFFSANGDGNVLVSDQQMTDALALCAQADKHAALGAMQAFGTTDFREDLTKISVPTLIMHGDSDGVVPFEGSGKLTHETVIGSELQVITGGPHGVNVSHAEEFNTGLVDFLSK